MNGRDGTARRSGGWIAAGLTLLATAPFVPMLVRGQLPVLRDHADYFIPLRWFTSRLLSAGVMPHWNPLNGLGEPWLANPQTGVLYPPSWLHVILPFQVGYVLYLILHLALLGGGVFLLARRISSPIGATVAAIAAMFCGPVLSLLDVSNNLASLAWLPWVVLTAGSMRSWLHRSLAGGLTLTLCFLAAEPTFAAIAAALFMTLTLTRDDPIRERWRCVIFAGAVSILFAGPQLIPFLLSLQGSDRTAGLEASAALANSIGAMDLVSLLAPPADPVALTVLSAARQQFLPSTFLSVTVCMLLAAGAAECLRNERRRTVAILSAVGLMSILSAVGSVGPLAETIGSLMSAIRHPARYLAVAVILAIPFAGAGVERFRTRMSASWYALAAVLFGIASWSVARNPSTFGIAALALDLGCFAFLHGQTRIGPAVRSAALLVLTSTLLLWSGSFAFVSAELKSLVPDVPSMPPGSRLAVRAPGGAGVSDGRPRRLPVGYLNLLVGVSKADTPAPVVPERVIRYLGVSTELSVVPLLSMAAVSRAQVTDEAEGGWLEIPPLPFVSGWNGAEPVASHDEALMRALSSPGETALFSPDRLPVIDRTDRKPVRVALQPVRSGWRLQVDAPAPVLLMMSERADRGWRVSVDGRDSQWGIVNGVFRAVPVDAGPHVVEWSYRTPGWRAGWIAFAAGALMVAVVRGIRRHRFLR